MSFRQRTALITGATRGIGCAIADAFAREGAKTILMGRNPERVKTVESRFLEKYGEEHRGVVLDVSDKDQVNLIVKDILKEHQIDYLINAAGISRDGLLLQMKDEDLQDTMNTNLLGTMRLTQLVAKSMIRKRKGGCIINISSVVGIFGNAGQSVYSASKAGVIGFSKSLAKELGPAGIRVNVLAPGFIETDMTADILNSSARKEALLKCISLRAFGRPEDVAEAAVFLAKSRYMHGQVLTIDGGLSL